MRLIRGGREYRLDVRREVGTGVGEADVVLDAGDIISVPSRLVGADRYYVLGEVRAPGSFPMTEGATVMDAISQAGSLTEYADTPGIFIGREGAVSHRTIPVDVAAVVEGQVSSVDYLLQPGDYIIVPRRDPTFWERSREWIVFTTLILNVYAIITLSR